ncbi:hypothetical protein BDV93DRAFT_612059 [Ceratobasidium sp. AG-I]|nr:hypothetical protein BDV93DRAFT_612059 [Ceratobasidium sp. AG-I]
MTATDPSATDSTNFGKYATPSTVATTESEAVINSGVATGSSDSVSLLRGSVLNPLKKNVITILLIGETGSGKTSLMSLLINLFQGNGPFELTDQHDPTKESGLSQAHSQTTSAKLYVVITSDGTKVQILDTPGLADTAGIGKDDEHKAEINSGIKDFIESIDAVLIVANGTVPRLGAATNYTLSVISSMFPHSIIDNICFLFTNSDLSTLNFQMDTLQPELRDSKYWAIQNPLSLHRNYRAQAGGGAPDRVLESSAKKLKGSYEEAVETLNEWLAWLNERKAQPTQDIHDLYQTFVHIESCIDATLSSLTRLHESRQRWKQIESDLENAEKRKDALAALTVQQTALFWDRQASETPNTLCIAADCYSNCHAPCNLAFLNDSAALGTQCSAFPSDPMLPAAAALPVVAVASSLARILPFTVALPSFVAAVAAPPLAVALPLGLLLLNWRAQQARSLKCNVCGHEAEEHRHYMNTHVQRPKEIDPETKKELDEATSDEQKLEAACNAVKQELKKIEEDILIAQEKTRRLTDKYNVVSLSKNFSGHIQSAIQMLKYRQKELESKPDTATELNLIEDSINELEVKLRVLRGEGRVEAETLAIAQDS